MAPLSTCSTYCDLQRLLDSRDSRDSRICPYGPSPDSLEDPAYTALPSTARYGLWRRIRRGGKG